MREDINRLILCHLPPADPRARERLARQFLKGLTREELERLVPGLPRKDLEAALLPHIAQPIYRAPRRS